MKKIVIFLLVTFSNIHADYKPSQEYVDLLKEKITECDKHYLIIANSFNSGDKVSAQDKCQALHIYTALRNAYVDSLNEYENLNSYKE